MNKLLSKNKQTDYVPLAYIIIPHYPFRFTPYLFSLLLSPPFSPWILPSLVSLLITSLSAFTSHSMERGGGHSHKLICSTTHSYIHTHKDTLFSFYISIKGVFCTENMLLNMLEYWNGYVGPLDDIKRYLEWFALQSRSVGISNPKGSILILCHC